MNFLRKLTLGHYVAGFLMFATFMLVAIVLGRAVNNENKAPLPVNYAVTKTAELELQLESDRRKLHDLCLTFLTPPLSENGAVVDVGRILSCKSYVDEIEFGQLLDYQAIRGSEKLMVFVDQSPFVIYYKGNKYESNYYDGLYSVVFDPIGKVATLQLEPSGGGILEVADTTVLIYPSGY